MTAKQRVILGALRDAQHEHDGQAVSAYQIAAACPAPWQGRPDLVTQALVRLRLAKALIGVAEANALAAESIAIERGIGTEEIAQTEALALHAAAFNGMPDPVFHLTARAMAIVMGLAAVEPDPRAPDNDVLLDAALQAATGLAQLLRFRGACATAETAAEREVTLRLGTPPRAPERSARLRRASAAAARVVRGRQRRDGVRARAGVALQRAQAAVAALGHEQRQLHVVRREVRTE